MAISLKNFAFAIYESGKDKSGKELDQFLKNTVEFIYHRGLLSKTPQIADELEKIIDRKDGVVKARVSSKWKLNRHKIDEIETILKKRYKAKDVSLDFREDKELLGGVKIEVGDEVLDTTLANKLKGLQNYLITN